MKTSGFDLRIADLEEALDIAICYIEEIAGSDVEESDTYKFLCEVLYRD